jgi:hypothetical protein
LYVPPVGTAFRTAGTYPEKSTFALDQGGRTANLSDLEILREHETLTSFGAHPPLIFPSFLVYVNDSKVIIHEVTRGVAANRRNPSIAYTRKHDRHPSDVVF